MNRFQWSLLISILFHGVVLWGSPVGLVQSPDVHPQSGSPRLTLQINTSLPEDGHEEDFQETGNESNMDEPESEPVEQELAEDGTKPNPESVESETVEDREVAHEAPSELSRSEPASGGPQPDWIPQDPEAPEATPDPSAAAADEESEPEETDPSESFKEDPPEPGKAAPPQPPEPVEIDDRPTREEQQMRRVSTEELRAEKPQEIESPEDMPPQRESINEMDYEPPEAVEPGVVARGEGDERTQERPLDGASEGVTWEGKSRVKGLHTPTPPYPPEAHLKGQEGSVELWLEIDSDGEVLDVTVQSSSGHPLLDEEARRTVRGWKFEPEPSNEDGKVVHGLIYVIFQLD